MNETQYQAAQVAAVETAIPTAKEIQKLSPSAIIDMVELDITELTGNSADVFRFHNGLNSGLKGVDAIGSLVWKGQTYTTFPYELTGIEFSSSGSLPRPRLKVGQINNYIGSMVYQYNNLLGGKVTRVRTLAKFLDRENYTGKTVSFTTAPVSGSTITALLGDGRTITLGTGDGVTTKFDTTETSIVTVFKSDWQGNQTQYITPRTNLLEYSEDVTQAEWVKYRLNTTGISNIALAPDGSLTADKLVSDAVNNTHYIQNNLTGTYTSGEYYTFSVYAKAAEHSGIRLYFANAIGTPSGNKWASFNLTTGTVIAGYTSASPQIQSVGNGWYRVSITDQVDTPANTTLSILTLAMDSSLAASFAGDNVKGIYVWGHQLEKSNIKTNYIKNTTNSTYTYTDIQILDGGNATADPNQEFPREVYHIDRKVANTPTYIEFELASLLDLAGVMLPRRQCVQNTCQWVYKSAECGYTGTNYFDANDKVCAQVQDKCGKRLRSCEMRFGVGNTLPYGGFPGVGRVGYA